MSQESKSSSEHQTRSSLLCSSCGETIVDKAYSVQRRHIRGVPKDNSTPLNTDVIDLSHGGVILGPEFDLYCQTCYSDLPTIQELINAHKK